MDRLLQFMCRHTVQWPFIFFYGLYSESMGHCFGLWTFISVYVPPYQSMDHSKSFSHNTNNFHSLIKDILSYCHKTISETENIIKYVTYGSIFIKLSIILTRQQ